MYKTIAQTSKVTPLFISLNEEDFNKNKTSYHLLIDDDTVFENVEIKVPNQKPIHYSKRTPITPKVNDDCFVSFDGKYVSPCKYLGAAGNRGIGDMASIKIKCKIRGYDHKESHIVLYDEIGLTPKQAIINTVTS